jgi:hypothetical protein
LLIRQIEPQISCVRRIEFALAFNGGSTAFHSRKRPETQLAVENCQIVGA